MVSIEKSITYTKRKPACWALISWNALQAGAYTRVRFIPQLSTPIVEKLPIYTRLQHICMVDFSAKSVMDFPRNGNSQLFRETRYVGASPRSQRTASLSLSRNMNSSRLWKQRWPTAVCSPAYNGILTSDICETNIRGKARKELNEPRRCIVEAI